MKKAQFLQHFQDIEKEQPIKISAVPYKHQGTTYQEDGIRITGSQEFIDSVLSRLTDLLSYENGSTRLQCVYKRTIDRETGSLTDSFNCYLQVHERGGQAQMMNAISGGVS